MNAANNTIIGNVTHDNEDSGIQFSSGGNNNLITLNVSYNNGDHGIDDLNVTGGRIIGNTVYRNCTSGINVEGTSGSYVIKNNVAVDNAIYPTYAGLSCSRRSGNIGVWDSAPSTTKVNHNLVSLSKAGTMYVFGSSYTSLAAMRTATGQEASGVQGDPRFHDAAAWDLQLNSGSPAIDRGDSGTPGEQATDLLGFDRVDDPAASNAFASGPRAYDDLGAYEFQPETLPSPVAPAAALSVSPGAGQAPVQVSADASGSTDAQGQTLSYSFDFGDGSAVVGPQAGATAAHTYAESGTYVLKVTVENTSGLSDSAQKTVTVTAPSAPVAPAAALSVSPGAGQAPVQVSADASGSTDAQGQTLSYSFDFGDGSAVVGPQAGATAAHTYAEAGTYVLKVTVENTSGLSDAAQKTVTVTAPTVPPAYVNQIATNYSTATKTSGSITVWRPAGVRIENLAVLTLQLAGMSATGTVSATDDAGNAYSVVSSVSDGSGNRLVVLAGKVSRTLAVNAKITATFPSATSYRMTGDEFAGVSSVDRVSSATGLAGTFSSGASAATTAPKEVAFAAVAISNGSANPGWATPWKDVGPYAVGTRYLGRAYQLPTSTTSLTATGNATGAWLASLVTFKP